MTNLSILSTIKVVFVITILKIKLQYENFIKTRNNVILGEIDFDDKHNIIYSPLVIEK